MNLEALNRRQPELRATSRGELLFVQRLAPELEAEFELGALPWWRLKVPGLPLDLPDRSPDTMRWTLGAAVLIAERLEPRRKSGALGWQIRWEGASALPAPPVDPPTIEFHPEGAFGFYAARATTEGGGGFEVRPVAALRPEAAEAESNLPPWTLWTALASLRLPPATKVDVLPSGGLAVRLPLNRNLVAAERGIEGRQVLLDCRSRPTDSLGAEIVSAEAPPSLVSLHGVRATTRRASHDLEEVGLSSGFSTLPELRAALSRFLASRLAGCDDVDWPVLRLFRSGKLAATRDATRAALMLAPFTPDFVVDALQHDETTSEREPDLRPHLGSDAPDALANLGLRMAFLPLMAHLLARALLFRRPAIRPLLGDPRLLDLPEALAAPLQFRLGEDLLVSADFRPEGDASPHVYLPPGDEWIEYHTGRRFQGDQTVALDPEPPRPSARAPLFVRTGAVLPLFDLGVRSASASDDPAVPGPPERLLLKIFPGGTGATERIFHDVFALRPLPAQIDADTAEAAPLLRVVHASVPGRLSLEIDAAPLGGRPRPLLLMIKCHRPARVLAGAEPNRLGPLAALERDEQFDRVTDCWMYHPYRDEVLVKTRSEEGGPLHLSVEYES